MGTPKAFELLHQGAQNASAVRDAEEAPYLVDYVAAEFEKR